jgi:hypothetical protein
MLSSFVQGSAEQAVCNNALSALTVLQGYRSPCALDAAGFPLPTTAPINTINSSSSSNTAPQQQQQQREVYKYRLPFRQLRAQPLQLLRAQVTASTVASLVPLARPLGLEASALYALLVETLYTTVTTATATGTATTSSQQQQQQQLPPFGEVQQWLQAVKSPAVACRSAQWVAQQCLLNSSSNTNSSSSSSSSSAIDSAIAALEHAVTQAKLAIAQGATALPLLPVRIAAQSQRTETAKQETATVTVVEEQELAADKVYKVLKHERMELRHHRVVLQHLDARYAAELSQFYGSR